MRVDGRTLKKLKHIPFETYFVSHRVISLSGDVEENPGPSNQCSATNTCNLAAYRSSMANSVSLLETRLSELNRTAVDVGGGGDCFFRAVSHQLYGNPNNHPHRITVNSPTDQLADANSPTYKIEQRRRRVGRQSNTTYQKLNIQKIKRYLVKKHW